MKHVSLGCHEDPAGHQGEQGRVRAGTAQEPSLREGHSVDGHESQGAFGPPRSSGRDEADQSR